MVPSEGRPQFPRRCRPRERPTIERAAAEASPGVAKPCSGWYSGTRWCPGEDSNFHVFRHTDLNRARLPIPPPGQTDGRRSLGDRVEAVNRHSSRGRGEGRKARRGGRLDRWEGRVRSWAVSPGTDAEPSEPWNQPTTSSPFSAVRALSEPRWCSCWPGAGYRIRVAVRRRTLPATCGRSVPSGRSMPIQANVRNPIRSNAPCAAPAIVINLVGIGFRARQAALPYRTTPGREERRRGGDGGGAPTLVHMSALGADPQSALPMPVRKALGETEVHGGLPVGDRHPALDHLRAGRRLLQSLRHAGPHVSRCCR